MWAPNRCRRPWRPTSTRLASTSSRARSRPWRSRSGESPPSTSGEGEKRSFDVVYSALGVTPRAQLAVQAGAKLDDSGRLIVGSHQETSVPGLYAAGDVVRGLNQISTAEGEGAIAATDVHNSLDRNFA
ncbi:NAD(P)/FAD-dependent oxidoreductase [Phenylobacterium sp. J426]|uniref:NAD(P)/FAD-dependent oxidoreductase n=1 Tax=Phenylobacterium sp. J426 TaxID=2898439 RepID=UPI002151697B|nr:FAD-dependent oxidoreductase [Phenylobacterium sp. J426]